MLTDTNSSEAISWLDIIVGRKRSTAASRSAERLGEHRRGAAARRALDAGQQLARPARGARSRGAAGGAARRTIAEPWATNGRRSVLGSAASSARSSAAPRRVVVGQRVVRERARSPRRVDLGRLERAARACADAARSSRARPAASPSLRRRSARPAALAAVPLAARGQQRQRALGGGQLAERRAQRRLERRRGAAQRGQHRPVRAPPRPSRAAPPDRPRRRRARRAGARAGVDGHPQRGSGEARSRSSVRWNQRSASSSGCARAAIELRTPAQMPTGTCGTSRGGGRAPRPRRRAARRARGGRRTAPRRSGRRGRSA